MSLTTTEVSPDNDEDEDDWWEDRWLAAETTMDFLRDSLLLPAKVLPVAMSSFEPSQSMVGAVDSKGEREQMRADERNRRSLKGLEARKDHGMDMPSRDLALATASATSGLGT
ncbi:hypothetical protein GUJ93_ZPchr0010g10827 [Zizania palustris]|uniref:Uncharacterized protein n=1 Tax=Zizania palustris TaxID=103762 RepID=A0A8J5WFN3_ZIZPA|nr:hypothetical protein GUJ93_ZPchr0010g10827 [Zizania palustris]